MASLDLSGHLLGSKIELPTSNFHQDAATLTLHALDWLRRPKNIEKQFENLQKEIKISKYSISGGLITFCWLHNPPCLLDCHDRCYKSRQQSHSCCCATAAPPTSSCGADDDKWMKSPFVYYILHNVGIIYVYFWHQNYSFFDTEFLTISWCVF